VGTLAYGPSAGPRGLDPLRVLVEIGAAGGLELERLARMLVPPAEGPWYRAARSQQAGPSPACLAGPLTLWTLRQAGSDEAFLAAAAASLARLTHADAASVADACLFALAMLHAALTGRVDAEPERRAEWERIAGRWAAGPPSGRIEAVLSASRAHPNDPAAARQASVRAHGDGDLAAALVGMSLGMPLAAAAAELVAAARAIDALAPGG
jgi:hypothetical protein